jgi:hypothetical protein
MRLLNVKAINEAPLPLGYLKEIDYISKQCEKLKHMNIFEYGRIIGIQQERARRKGVEYKKPILVDDFCMELIKLIDKVASNVDYEQVDEFFVDLAAEVINSLNDDSQVESIMGIITAAKLMAKNKAPKSSN